jgi:hypothetical protein
MSLDFELAAKKLRCDVAAIKAVAKVEAAGEGFVLDRDTGKTHCVRLFERHKFHKFTGGRFDNSHPHLSDNAAGGYSKGVDAEERQKKERAKFSEAFRLDRDAAMMSCSWGMFQIMGFNHKACGFFGPGAFVDAMKESEQRQLDAFVEFLLSSHLDDELRERNWESFARGYNGPGYRANNYHMKMKQAYEEFSR